MKKNRKKRLIRIAERKQERQLARQGVTCLGILKMTHSGFGFVTPDPVEPEAEVEDIFIPPQFVNQALDGDRVKVRLLPPRREFSHDTVKRGPAGEIIEIVEPKRTSLVGEVVAGGVVRPLDTHLPEEFQLRGARKGAKRGDWVRINLHQDSHGGWSGQVSKVLGRAGVIASDLDAVMAEYELPERYSEADNAEALKLEPREISREDHTQLCTVTIDPIDAKDFDDALSIAPGTQPGTVTIGVHISDVAAYIAPKGRFDKMAALRGFSCYLPGRTLPMLPPALTAKISLAAGRVALAHSVWLQVDAQTGEVLSARRGHSKIQVDYRLNYDEVQEFADQGTAPENWSAELKKSLKLLIETTRKMRAFRAGSEEFIELPLHEVHVLCDEANNKLEGISSKLSRESEQLVEECMLAANSAVGQEFFKRSVAGIYRVHAEPDPDKALEFSEMVAASFGIVPGDICNRKICNKFIRSLRDDARKEVILSLLLRSFPRAEYAAQSLPHFALGKRFYSHFTSPIRRYTDLIVHQQLWNLDSKVRTRSSSTLAVIAERCTALEEQVDAASFAAEDRMKLRLLEERLERGDTDVYEGVIAKVISAGLQVAVVEWGIYGFVPREALPGEMRRGKFALRRAQGQGAYKAGDYIYLQLAQIDFARGSAIFVPAGR